jgi:hypothetical protein
MTSSPSFISSLICTLVAVAACGSDDSADTPDVVEPTTLAIAELRPSGGDAWRAGDPEPVALGCDRLLGVALELTNWTLRPRGACGSLDQCGYVHAELTTPNGVAVSIDTALASFVFDLGGVELSSDEAATIRVQLHDGDGAPFEQPAGEVLTDELDVALDGSVDPGCESGSAGAGGQSGAAGTGGSGGDATEGGAAGAANEAGSGGVPGAGGDATSPGGGAGGDSASSGGVGGEAGSAATDGGAGGDSAASGAAGEAGGPSIQARLGG